MAHDGDQPDKQTGGSASQLLPGKTWRLSLPARLAPVTLVFRLRGSGQDELHNAPGPHFAVPVGMIPGQASMLGECCSGHGRDLMFQNDLSLVESLLFVVLLDMVDDPRAH